MDSPDAPDALARELAALQAQGAAERAPLAWHCAEALAQRRLAHAGAVRQQLDCRLRVLLDSLRQPGPAAEAHAAAPPRAAGPLAALAFAAAPGDGGNPAPAEWKAVQLFGSTWARVRVDAQLRRASARPRGAVGPLNSQRVMLQALQQLQQLSPAYLQHFMAQAETLLWLEDSAAAPPPVDKPARPSAERPAQAPADRPARPAGTRRRTTVRRGAR